jgi:hypothetical protein
VNTRSRDIAGWVHRPLLQFAGCLWASYLLSQIPFDPGSDLVRGMMGGFFVVSLVLGTCVAGAAFWVSLRVRRHGCYWAAAVSLPLAALCWWQLLTGWMPGRV